MNFKQFFVITSIVAGSVLIVLIILFFINNAIGKCAVGDNISKDGKCFYTASTCREGDEPGITDEGVNVCLYSKKGFLNTKIMVITLIILGVIWLLVFMIFIFVIIKKGKPAEMSMFRKEDFVNPHRAEQVWALSWSRRNGIPVFNNKYKESAFFFYSSGEPWQRGKEWFYKFQVEVKEGNYQGVFTVLTSISRGEDLILNGGYRWKHCLYDDYKIKRDMPIHTPEDATERLIEQLWQSSPEKAMQLQEQMIEKRIAEPPPSEQLPPQQVPMVRMPMRRPYYRQPYRRYY